VQRGRWPQIVSEFVYAGVTWSKEGRSVWLGGLGRISSESGVLVFGYPSPLDGEKAAHWVIRFGRGGTWGLLLKKIRNSATGELQVGLQPTMGLFSGRMPFDA